MSKFEGFAFVADRAPQGTLSGEFAPMADQTKYRSIYGVVEGPQVGPFTASMIENGEIFSGDGKARLGGTAVLDKDGKFHEVTSGGTRYREYQVPKDAVEKWNKYEAKQGNDQVRAFHNRELSKAVSHGRDPFIEFQNEEMDPEDIQWQTEPQAAPPGEKPKRTLSPEHKAKLAAGRAAKLAAKVA